MSKALHSITLFTSFGTLICCALPALLVTLGMGAVVASAVSTVPELVWLSKHKDYVFSFAGVMLSISGFSRYKTRNSSCPIDPELAKACKNSRRLSGVIYYLSLTIFLTGIFFAYIAPKIL